MSTATQSTTTNTQDDLNTHILMTHLTCSVDEAAKVTAERGSYLNLYDFDALVALDQYESREELGISGVFMDFIDFKGWTNHLIETGVYIKFNYQAAEHYATRHELDQAAGILNKLRNPPAKPVGELWCESKGYQFMSQKNERVYAKDTQNRTYYVYDIVRNKAIVTLTSDSCISDYRFNQIAASLAEDARAYLEDEIPF